MTRTAEERMEALLATGMLLASELSLDAVLQKIVDAACDIADARYGALGVLDEAHTGLADFITHGVTDLERRAIGHLPVGLGLLGALITDPRPLRLSHLEDDPRSVGVPAHHPEMHSFLGVPVSIRGRVFGNLYLTQKRGGSAFTDHDEAAVVTLASQAAVAIENARLYAAAQAEQRRLHAINRVDAAVLDDATPDQIARTIADAAKDLLGCESAVVALRTRDVLTVRGGDADLLGRTLPMIDRPSSDLVFEIGKQIPTPPILAAAVEGPGVLAFLQASAQPVGVLIAWRPREGHPFLPEQIGALTTFASHAAVAAEFAQARADLARLALIDERERIAREIHDGVVQGLFSVGLSLQAAAGMTADDGTRSRISAAIEGIDDAIKSLRGYIFGELPTGGEGDGVLQRLRDLSVAYAHDDAPSVAVFVDEQVPDAIGARAPDVLQIVREAVSNAVRHAKAATVSVDVRRTSDAVIVVIEDDGVGFDPTARHAGHGLANITARTEAIGGTVTITSSADEGTAVRVVVPIAGRS